MIYATTATVTAGRVILTDRDQFAAAFAKWPDGRVWVTFETPLIFRSPGQNAYWHAAIVAPLATHCGVTPRQMHDALKILLLPEPVVVRRADGSTLATVVTGGRTSRLTRPEAANLTDRATAILRAAGIAG